MAKKSFKIQNNLVNALDNTVSAANNNAGELNIQPVPISKIRFDDNNPRDLSSENKKNLSLDTLAKSIEQHGLLNPILVYKNQDYYQLIAGHRRTLAAILAEKIDIPAKILETKPNELKLSQLQWMENIEREDLSLWERLNNINKIVSAFKKLHNRDAITATELSELLGCSLQQAVNYNNILNSSKQLKKLIETNKIKSIDKAATIAKSEPDQQPLLIDACLKGASLKKLKQLVNTPLKSLESKKTLINLGQTANLELAKYILNLIINNLEFEDLNKEFPAIDWSDINSINLSFKHLMRILEEVPLSQHYV